MQRKLLLLRLLVVCGSASLGRGDDQTEATTETLPSALVNPQRTSAPPTEPVVMEKITIRETKQSSRQMQALIETLNPKTVPPSLQDGGMLRRKIGNKELEVGVIKSPEFLKEDAKYKDKTPLIKVDLFRLKF